MMVDDDMLRKQRPEKDPESVAQSVWKLPSLAIQTLTEKGRKKSMTNQLSYDMYDANVWSLNIQLRENLTQTLRSAPFDWSCAQNSIPTTQSVLAILPPRVAFPGACRNSTTSFSKIQT